MKRIPAKIRHTSYLIPVIAQSNQIDLCTFCLQAIQKGERMVRIYDSDKGFDIGHWPCKRLLQGVKNANSA